MRTTSDSAHVRLYHLDEDGGAAVTIVYAPMGEVLRIAAAQPEDARAGLFIQTDNDVIAYLDLIGG